ncbi:MAG: 50S ribosomal protein L11 methyltransferase [Puniceicoccales bacterium]|jgi:ribosomal protein L11 methyltransferase|nr:50S ribosomal protein L11 methyltransferase [Puniceicoccales bacterium]
MTQPLEDHFCELTRSPWMLFNEKPSAPHTLSGFFDSVSEAADAWADLRKVFKKLPETPEYATLADRDWKEAYKANLHPWQHGRLHWVPEWRRDSYAAPDGDAVVYFDAGLAFGTGDHPTTRLCAMRLIDFLAGKNAPAIRVTDAGCGSGILALSAAKLGCGRVFGFDRDPEAVRVSLENRTANALPETAAAFVLAGLENGLRDAGSADIVLANIISDVLCIYADNLLAAVSHGGVLALSGILASEQDTVRQLFVSRAQAAWSAAPAAVECRIMGDWCDVALFRAN